MNKRRPVGFRAAEDSAPESPNVGEEIVIRFFEENYLPVGRRENTEFRTTDELLYELRETVYVTPGAMNKILAGLDFQIRFLDGTPHWVLYSKTGREE